eukprot:11216613-Lingulodinium_polyedra.AAC.1
MDACPPDLIRCRSLHGQTTRQRACAWWIEGLGSENPVSRQVLRRDMLRKLGPSPHGDTNKSRSR